MLTAREAIEQLIAAGAHKVDMTNAQPFLPDITLADTLEAKVAELISHLAREEDFRLLFECRLSGQVSDAQWQVHLQDPKFYAWVARQPARRAPTTQPPVPDAPLTAALLADALDAFWNASIGYSREQRLSLDALQTICGVAAGFAAVSAQLRTDLQAKINQSR